MLKRSGYLIKHRTVYCLSQRNVFAFNPTSTPKAIENYQLLYRKYERESDEAQKFLKKHGYLHMISLRDITNNPLTFEEIRQLRYTLGLPFDLWTDPPIHERSKHLNASEIEMIIQRMVIGSVRPNKPTRKMTEYLSNESENFHRILTPILFNKKENKGVIAKPADKMISLLKPSHRSVQQTYYGNDSKANAVSGKEWQRSGARFYDCDEGYDWSHVRFEDYEKSQQKSFKEWSDWNEEDYVNENVADDPNTVDAFFQNIPKKYRRQ